MQPVIIVGLTALALVFARIAGAQQTNRHRLAFATHAIARGAVLGADDIEYRDSTTRDPADINPISAGWVTRRMIAAGEVLRAPAVEPPVIVAANAPVEMEWTDRNVRLIMRGVATRNAALGDRVPVRTESGKRIDAVVIGPGRVRID